MPLLDAPVTRRGIAAASRAIDPYIRRTPVLSGEGLEGGARVSLKLELMQHAGAFKTRGAFANLLLRQVPKAGVVAASGGNHGVAVAYAAGRLGIPAKVFVPSISSATKVDRIRGYGADLVVGGDRYADALAASEAWAASSGALAVHAFDQVETLLGAGTVGLEFERQTSNIDTVLVGVGGGGLIGGVAGWFAGSVKVVGVEPTGAPTLTRALEAGHPVDAPTDGIAADSLAPRQVGALMFPIAQRFVDHVVLVDDGVIRRGQQHLWDEFRIVAEPGGAAAFGALVSGAYAPDPGEHVGVILSGANTTAVSFET